MARLLHIGLIFDDGTGSCRGVLRGIKQFAAAWPHWVLMSSVPELRALGALARLNVGGGAVGAARFPKRVRGQDPGQDKNNVGRREALGWRRWSTAVGDATWLWYAA
jgi:hypothetical protein